MDLLVCGGLNFPGVLDFEEGKALFWHWIVPILEIFTCGGPFYLALIVNLKKFTCSKLLIHFRRINNMVNTVKQKVTNDVYAIVKYTILCTEKTNMCKLTKNLPIQGGLLDFQDPGGRI